MYKSQRRFIKIPHSRISNWLTNPTTKTVVSMVKQLEALRVNVPIEKETHAA
jgi:hypothetical protein